MSSNNPEKLILVISDLHLGAGKQVKGRRNLLEDFHFDDELVEFLNFYSSGEFEQKEVELIINGDFLDLLAIPYVEFFDDEFWSEEASMAKLEMILDAHKEVMGALNQFLHVPQKKILYIIGNHDSELVFESLKQKLREQFDESVRDQFVISNEIETYNPVTGVYLQHGHQYESAHDFDPNNSIVEANGKKYFIPSWGAYYVVNVVNKYKQERHYINAVRPIKHFIIHGLIFDTFFTARMGFSNFYYFFMVRFWYYIQKKVGWKKVIKDLMQELTLFQDYDSLTRDFFSEHPDAKVLIVGHTHNPMLRIFNDGTTFINTGTWTKMINLDLGQWNNSHSLTYAMVKTTSAEVSLEKFSEQVEVDLKVWKGKNTLPYLDFS